MDNELKSRSKYINKFISQNEIILFEPRKKFSRIIIDIFLLLITIYITFMLIEYLNKNTFNMPFEAVIILFLLATPTGILTFISDTYDKLIITNMSIFISKGVAGKLYIINLSDISNVYINSLYLSGEIVMLFIYLKNGKLIKMNNSNLKIDIEKLHNIFNDAGIRIISYPELKNNKYNNNLNIYLDIKKRYIFPIICFIPFLFAGILIILHSFSAI